MAEIAKRYDTHIQSHCSEGDWEHQHVYDRFDKRDTELLNGFGLLGHKSIMAHCNFIDENGGNIFDQSGTAVGHCPLSNAYFANAV